MRTKLETRKIMGFHYFKNSWQPQLGEMLKITLEEKLSSRTHAKYAKDGKTVVNIPNFMSKQMHVFIKHSGTVVIKINSKIKFSKDLNQGG